MKYPDWTDISIHSISIQSTGKYSFHHGVALYTTPGILLNTTPWFHALIQSQFLLDFKKMIKPCPKVKPKDLVNKGRITNHWYH